MWVLFHELAHILLGHFYLLGPKPVSAIDESKPARGKLAPAECRAVEWSADVRGTAFLVRQVYDAFKHHKANGTAAFPMENLADTVLQTERAIALATMAMEGAWYP